MLVRMWNNRDSHPLLVRIKNGTVTVENGMVVYQIFDIELSYDSATLLLSTSFTLVDLHLYSFAVISNSHVYNSFSELYEFYQITETDSGVETSNT